MIVPQQSGSYQEDIYLPTASAQPSLTAQVPSHGACSLCPQRDPSPSPRFPPHFFNQTERLVAEDGRRPFSLLEEKAPRWAAEHRLEKKTWLTDCSDIFECPPPKAENELLQTFYWLQDETQRLWKLVTQDKVQAEQLELEIRHLWMSSQRL